MRRRGGLAEGRTPESPTRSSLAAASPSQPPPNAAAAPSNAAAPERRLARLRPAQSRAVSVSSVASGGQAKRTGV